MPNEAAPESTQSAPAPAPEPSAPQSAPESTAGPESAAPAPDAAAPEPKPEAKPEPRLLSQDEVNRIVRRERRAAEDRAYQRARLEAENEWLRKQVGQPRGDQPNATQGTGDVEPTPDQFKDWDAYSRAFVRWEVRQTLREQSQGQQKEKEQAGRAEYAQTVRSKLEEGAAKFEDFEEVVTGPDVAFTDPMIDALMYTPNPADVAYHLGQNPKESQRIARLSTAAQAFAIRELADKLAKPPAPTKAPEPIKPNSGNAAGVEPSLDAVAGNYKEWKRLRERQLAQKN